MTAQLSTEELYDTPHIHFVSLTTRKPRQTSYYKDTLYRIRFSILMFSLVIRLCINLFIYLFI